MEIVILVMVLILLYAAIKQHKLAKKINRLDDKLRKIMEKELEKWKN